MIEIDFMGKDRVVFLKFGIFEVPFYDLGEGGAPPQYFEIIPVIALIFFKQLLFDLKSSFFF